MAAKVRTATNRPGPKFYAAVVVAIVNYLLTQELLKLPVWAVLLCNAITVGYAVWQANPQPTVAASFALPGAVVLLGVAGAHGLLSVVVILVVVGFLLGALYLAVRLREYLGAGVCVLLAIVVAVLLL